MNYQKTRAARLLAVGETIQSVAGTVGKTENTLKMWMLEPVFRKILLDNMEGAALRVVQGYLSGEHDNKDRATTALALLRLVRAKAPGRPRKDPNRRDDEEDTDLDEFSEEAIKRLAGGD
ncbi:hypothetical protein LCGC14_3103310 [marine sediment metagenome]|uniref:Uncharacterized protein n=1 Tax=marine sediment metagenome TaxID=412755 RepID=A0A0F8WW05_9ZZZZ